ncbi:MAG: branched-chain amino acid aminotransferase [Planctomycetaceae bacterium]|nr:branched-chain amino acid aminotransferase [Planctomycetaceae bacterium]
MLKLINALRRDEAGFVVSAELILISTIAVLSLIVGLSELSNNVNNELEDVGSAIGAVNQTYCYTLASGAKGSMAGSHFGDRADECDSQFDLTCNSAPQSEYRNHDYNW